ncbi:MAG: PASTA domain-containing protein [Oscillospiraceae bacterium]|nr:PASTA domain-containing protein [Oscillospiraceae bacterium]
MSWYSTDTEKFPAAVQLALLPEGTKIHNCYVISHALRVCGTELSYLAEDSRTREQMVLHEILPMRWCMRDENGCWVPYQSDAQTAYDSIRSTCLNRLQQLQNQHEETAVEIILDLFEDFGTIWFVTEYNEQKTLSYELGEKLYSPQEAIDQLTPVMDTITGLHGQGLFHGNISEHTIILQGDSALLTSWSTAVCAEDASLNASADVQAVSRLLYRMMTGEQQFSKETAAILPSGIRNAIRSGLENPDMTMEQLWMQLHTDRPEKRTKRIAFSEGSDTGLTRKFTILFCAMCLLFASVCAGFVFIGSRLKDSSYTLSDAQVRVPELLYLSQEEAVTIANDLGLNVIIAARQNNPVIEENHITMQKPSAGAVLSEGDTIQLTVSDGWQNYVPNVCNMMLEEAQNRLTQLGFVVEYQEIESVGNAPGTVISQSEEPNQLLQRDSVIMLKVSLGRKDIDTSKREVVGNYVGKQFDEAKELLSEKCLYALQAEAVYDKDVPKGCVISQNIPEGRRVPQGTVIEMKVSLGVETVRVPKVERMSASNARETLEKLRLKPVLIYSASSKYAADSVIEQSVAAGKIIPVGSEVWLTISTGKGSSVISTGGWSGDPLPTMQETDVTQTEEADATELESETDETEESVQTTDTTDLQDSTRTTSSTTETDATSTKTSRTTDKKQTTTTATKKETATTTKETATTTNKKETTTKRDETTVPEAKQTTVKATSAKPQNATTNAKETVDASAAIEN